MMTVDDEIRAIARRLQLPVVSAYRDHLDEAPPVDFAATLLHLLQVEADGKQERSFARRIKQAQFPYLKTLDTFIQDRLPHLTPAEIRALAACHYLREGHNVVAFGNSGTGKTHLSIALGAEAAWQGFSVRFHQVRTLVDQLTEARDNRELRQQMRPLERCDLLILDNLGYHHLSQPEASLLFQLFTERHERKSTYITTNLEFSKWAERLGGDQQLTSAFVDRFAHKSVLLNMNGPSYRLEDGGKATNQGHPSLKGGS